MEAAVQVKRERWDQMTERIDLVFVKMGDMDRTQQQMSVQMSLSAQVFERLVQDQSVLAKQIENRGQAVAHLTLEHPPESSRIVPELSRDTEVRSPRESFQRSSSESSRSDKHYLPKMSFVVFAGTNPRIWKDKCLNYFRIFNIPDHLWVSSASMNMDEKSSRWLQVYKLQHGITTWDNFIAAVEKQFGSYDYRDAMGDLVALSHEGSLEDYISAFEDLQYQVQMYNQGLDEVYFITQFIKGLKSEIAAGVQAQVPETMLRAIMLARVQQKLADSQHFKTTKYPSRSQSALPKWDTKNFTNNTNSTLWKERQLRDFRKANGLCMYCGDKFSQAHAATCAKRPQAQVHALVVNDLDQSLSEEVLTKLAMEDSVTEEIEKLSLNAISGTTDGEVLKIQTTVKNKVMLLLLESGSSHSFVSTSFLATTGLIAVPMAPKKVQVANGQVLVSDHIVPQMEWLCQGYTMSSDMKVLDLGSYDAILGYDWLKLHSPMICHWADHTVTFRDQGKNVKLHGIKPSPMALSTLSTKGLVKLQKSNDVWVMALVNFVEPIPTEVSSDLEALLTEFEDVFSKPTTLPPKRVYDHAIPLIPGAVLVNA
ncbi:unnamed protein product [Urochloa humidicola]